MKDQERKNRQAANSRAYRLRHPERVRQYSAKYHAAHRDEINARKKVEWKNRSAARIQQIAQYRENNREKLRQKSRRHREENLALYAAYQQKRIADKLQRIPAWADLDAIRLKYEQAKRATQLTGVPHNVDHTVPLRGKNVCGLHCESNLQVTPAIANRYKSNSFPSDGYREFFQADGSVIFEIGTTRMRLTEPLTRGA